MERRQGRRFTPDKKWAILQEGRQPGASVSEVCRRHQIGATQFYEWERRALEARPASRPRIVHDHGSQFVAKEWRQLVAQFELVDIATRLRHPESNGRIERYHRSVREEALTDQANAHFGQAKEVITRRVGFYNEQRLHAALQYLRPVDYYHGDPKQRMTRPASGKRSSLTGNNVRGDHKQIHGTKQQGALVRLLREDREVKREALA